MLKNNPNEKTISGKPIEVKIIIFQSKSHNHRF